jgi:hypothetical protein
VPERGIPVMEARRSYIGYRRFMLSVKR